MNAVISGLAGLALVMDGERIFSIHADALDIQKPRQATDFHYLFTDTKNLQYCTDISLNEVKERLLGAVQMDRALHVVLSAMDADLSHGLRERLLEELSGVLALEPVQIFLENILYARPLPLDADIEGALWNCDNTSLEVNRARDFYLRLFGHQRQVQAVQLAWEEISPLHFGKRGQRAVEGEAAKAGLFRGLVLCLAEQKNVDGWMAAELVRPEVRRIQNHRAILKAWIEPFQKARVGRVHPMEMMVDGAAEEVEVIQTEARVESGYDRLLSYEKVNKQKQDIERLMRGGNEALVWPRVEDLVSYQLKYGGPQFAVKSLCDLAVRAQARGMYGLQLRLTQKGVEIYPRDIWCWKQHGHALKNNGQYEEALLAYDRAGGALGDAVTQNGRAEVLKAMGQLSPALKAYEDVIKTHPENVVAKAGRAEVLKAMGQLDKARLAYEDLIKTHPGDVFAKNGRAEVLKAMGQLDKALVAYEDVIKAHPENVVAKTGRAEVLKAMGQLDKALAAYEDVIKAHPENVVAKNGRVEVLKAMGQLDEALVAYEDVTQAHPGDVVAKTGRAEVLKAMGQLDPALKAYEDVIKTHPGDVFAKTGRAEVLKAMGQLDKALAAYEDVIKAHPENVVAKNGRAEVLKAMGQLDKARLAYEDLIKTHPENVVAKTGRAEVLKAMGQLDKALAAYEDVIKAHPGDVVAKAGRAEVLKAMGQLDPARLAYEDVIKAHPENVVAKSGLACVLAALRRWDDALALLPSTLPKHTNDWIGYHIRGMILLKSDRIGDAIQCFESGLGACPIPRSKDYFRNALGSAYLRQNRLKAASQVLSEVQSDALKPAAFMLLTHAEGAQGNTLSAKACLDSLRSVPPAWAELFEELHRRFVLNDNALHSDQWLLDQEFDMLFNSIDLNAA